MSIHTLSVYVETSGEGGAGTTRCRIGDRGLGEERTGRGRGRKLEQRNQKDGLNYQLTNDPSAILAFKGRGMRERERGVGNGKHGLQSKADYWKTRPNGLGITSTAGHVQTLVLGVSTTGDPWATLDNVASYRVVLVWEDLGSCRSYTF